jgi:hypothetical protein
MLVDRLDGLARFLDKQLEDLRIDAIAGVRNHRPISRWPRPCWLPGFRSKWRRYNLCGGQIFAAGWRRDFRQQQRIETATGILEHPVRLATPGLDRLHVVLEADDRVSQPLQRCTRLQTGTALHDFRGCGRDTFRNPRSRLTLSHAMRR